MFLAYDSILICHFSCSWLSVFMSLAALLPVSVMSGCAVSSTLLPCPQLFGLHSAQELINTEWYDIDGLC